MKYSKSLQQYLAKEKEISLGTNLIHISLKKLKRKSMLYDNCNTYHYFNNYL